MSRIVIALMGALMATAAWAQQARVMQHWDGAVINPPAAAGGRGQ